MIGWWSGFPFGETFGVCAIGGILGVMYSVPLRRALRQSIEPALSRGRGRGRGTEGRHGRRGGASAAIARGCSPLVGGALASAGFASVVATRVFAGDSRATFVSATRRPGSASRSRWRSSAPGSSSGISVGLAIAAGLFIAWAFATPILTALHPMAGPAAGVATAVWSHQVRFIGAGAIGIAALWSLGRLARPVAWGVASALAASRRRRGGDWENEPRTERDLPIAIVGLVSLCCADSACGAAWPTFLPVGRSRPSRAG